MAARIKASELSAEMQTQLAQATARRSRFGRGRRQPGVMNKLEARYAAYLEQQKAAGVILEYHFEAVKLRLAEKCFYTPDFLILEANGDILIAEVKGHWEDDARIKIKVAASKYPFRFIAVRERSKKNGGGWEVEDF